MTAGAGAPEAEVDAVERALGSSEAGPAAIRGSALRTAGYVTSLLLSLISVPLLVRHLGVEDWGRYSAVLAVFALAMGFSEGGVNSIAVREWSTAGPGRRGTVMQNLLGLRIALAAAAGLAGATFALAAGYDRDMVTGAAILGIAVVVFSVQSLLLCPLQAELRFGWVTGADVLRQVLVVGLLVGLVLTGAGLVPLLAAQVPAAFGALALTVLLVRRTVPLRPRFDRAVWWPLLRDVLPYALAIAVTIAYLRLGLMYMSIVSTELETGYYAISFRIIEVVIAVPPVLMAAAFPILSRSAVDDPDRFGYAARRVFEVGLQVGALGAVGLCLGAPVAVDVIAGASGEPAVEVLRLQAAAVAATFAAVACAYPLLALRRHREVLVTSLAGLVTTAIALVVLVGPFGALGAAGATVLAEIAVAVTMALALQRSRPSVALPLRAVAWVLVAIAAALAVALVPELPALADLAAGTAVFVAVLAVGRRLPSELMAVVRR